MQKAKRRLKDFNFEGQGSAVALVGKHQGGAANGYTTLVTKATDKIPDSFIQKATQVQVTLSIDEFLRKFFNMYWDDAEILARMLGFVTEDMDWQERMEDMRETDSFDSYIQEKVESVEIMKSIFKADDIYKAVSELSDEQFEQFLHDQKLIEKAMSSASPEGVSNQNDKEDVTKMSEDMIQKSEVETMIEKAVGELKTDLAKAQEQIEAHKAKEQEAQVEARKGALKDAVKDEEKAESLFKSLEGVSDEAFTNAVQALKSLVAASEESEMFTEKGVDAEQKEPAAKDSATAAYLKKKYSGE